MVSAADTDKHLSYNDVTMTTPGSTTIVRPSAVKRLPAICATATASQAPAHGRRPFRQRQPSRPTGALRRRPTTTLVNILIVPFDVYICAASVEGATSAVSIAGRGPLSYHDNPAVRLYSVSIVTPRLVSYLHSVTVVYLTVFPQTTLVILQLTTIAQFHDQPPQRRLRENETTQRSALLIH